MRMITSHLHSVNQALRIYYIVFGFTLISLLCHTHTFAQSTGQKLYITQNTGEGSISRMNLDGSSFQTLLNGAYSTAIAIDSRQGRIFYTTPSGDIARANPEFTQGFPITTGGLPQIRDMAVSLQDNVIYYSTGGSVSGINLSNGSISANVGGFGDIRDVVVHEENRELFLLETNDRRIFRGTIPNLTDVNLFIDGPIGQGMAIDEARELIYWGDPETGRIYLRSFQGSSPTPVTSGIFEFIRAMTIDPLTGDLYFYLSSSRELRCWRRSDGDIITLIGGLQGVTDIEIYTPRTYTVTSNADSGPGTLREAIELANNVNFTNNNNPYTINFDASVTEISVLSPLVIRSHIRINGATTTLNAEGQSRIMEIQNPIEVNLNNLIFSQGVMDALNRGGAVTNLGATVSFSSCTFQNTNVSPDIAFTSGVVYNQSGSMLMNDCNVQNNTLGFSGITQSKGAINNDGSLTMNRCTIFNNQATNIEDARGAGIYQGGAFASSRFSNCTVFNNALLGAGSKLGVGMTFVNGTVELYNCTVSSNEAGSGGIGGGIFVDPNVNFQMTNVLIADNGAPTNPDFSGSGLELVTHCLIRDATGLGSFPDNGSNILNLGGSVPILTGTLTTSSRFTQTVALVESSPAINTGTTVGSPSQDQLGNNRVAQPDIGAFEFQGVSPTVGITNVSNIGSNTASVGGSVVNNGGATITQRGIIYYPADGTDKVIGSGSISQIIDQATGTGNFALTIPTGNLNPATQYSARAYATNAIGTSYGQRIDFWTLATEPISQVTGLQVSNQTPFSVELTWSLLNSANGYLVLYQSGANPPTASGVLDGNAVAALSLPTGVILGADIQTNRATIPLPVPGDYSFVVIPYAADGVTPQTTNYKTDGALAALTVSIGGNAVLLLSGIDQIQPNSARVNANISNIAGGNASERGVIYYPFAGQDFELGASGVLVSSESGSFGTGGYARTITGLNPGTRYETRAFARNNGGVFYSPRVDFYTLANEPISHVGSFSIQEQNLSQVTLTWSALSDASGYLVLKITGNTTPTNFNFVVDGNRPEDLNLLNQGINEFIDVPNGDANSVAFQNVDLKSANAFFIIPYGNTNAVAQTYNYKTNGIIPATQNITAPPNSPNGLIGQAISGTSIELSWTDNSSTENRFEILRKDANSNIETFLKVGETTPNTTNFVDSRLFQNVTYEYVVRACNSIGCSGASLPVTIQTPAPLNAPSDLTATTFSTSQIDLAWQDNSDNETGFQIFRSLQGDGGINFNLITTVGEDVTAYSDINLLADTVYIYIVRAINANDTSRFSDPVGAETVNVPLTPSNLVLNPLTDTTILLTWTDNSNNELTFVIERANLLDDGEVFFPIAEVNANITSYTDTSVIGNQQYTYRVSASNNEGRSGFSEPVATITAPEPGIIAPDPPLTLEAEAVTTSEISLRWEDNASNELFYSIERSINDSLNFIEIDRVKEGITTYQDIALQENNIYYYRVRAGNTGGFSPYSNIAFATPECNLIVAVSSSKNIIANICSDKSALLELSTNTLDASFQWLRNGEPIEGATQNTYLAFQDGEYNCQVFVDTTCNETAATPVVVILDESFGLQIGLEDSILTASIIGAERYQWFYDFEAISGATSDIYEPRLSGVYYLVATNDNCTATSNLFFFSVTGLEETDLAQSLEVYPNPSQEEIKIDLNNTQLGAYEIHLINGQGIRQLLDSGQKTDAPLKKTFDISDFQPGLYLLEIRLGNQRGLKKILKN